MSKTEIIAAPRVSAKEICVAGVMAAFVFIATFVPQIPIPLGYAHLGDGAIFLAVFLTGRRAGIFAGAFGSALADLAGGFPVWILPTLIIKAVMAEIFYRAALAGNDAPKFSSLRVLGGMVLACLFMTAGYTLAGAFLYDSLALGLASTPGLLVKSAVNIAAACLAGGMLSRAQGIHIDKV
ncbi:MAG: ECF transporter S component [Schwartzia sp.]|nr:ECF transporter S component [Schwartzia sp. (in: firmicutes)]